MDKKPIIDDVKTLEGFIGLGAPDEEGNEPALPESLNFLRRFAIISKIDKGAHGQIMMARDKEEDRFVAIKFMPRNQRHKGKLEKELFVFDALNKIDSYPTGFPQLISKGKTEYFYYYIMEKLGKCLKKVHCSCKRGKMKVDQVVDIGLQIVDRLEILHNAGLVHKDIKPANICFGMENPEDPRQDNSKTVYLIDYGLTKKASNMRMKRVNEDFLKPENLRLTGTPIYASIHSHMGSTQCYKKDDIESLVYMLIHLARGRLPWLFVDVKPGDNYINIFKCKREISAKELVGSLPVGFVALVDYARNMDKIDQPDYNYLRRILSEIHEKHALKTKHCDRRSLSPVPGAIDRRRFMLKWKSNIAKPAEKIGIPSNKKLVARNPFEGTGVDNSGMDSDSKTYGNFLKVCTNSVSVVNDPQVVNHRFHSKSQNKSRVVVIYDDDGNNEEEKEEEIAEPPQPKMQKSKTNTIKQKVPFECEENEPASTEPGYKHCVRVNKFKEMDLKHVGR